MAVRPEEACGSCQARAVCGAPVGDLRTMTVPVADTSEFTTGETVEVSIERAMGIKAVLLAYVAPFIIMFTVLLVMLRLGYSEPKAGLCSLASIAVWYAGLRVFRRKLDREIIFKVYKTDE